MATWLLKENHPFELDETGGVSQYLRL